jgi:predicted lipid carrier protein YhbT/chorismate mutase
VHADPLNQWMLSGTRHAIDWVDDGMVRLLFRRQQLASIAGRIKRHAGIPQSDPDRESGVQRRARHLALRRGLSTDSAARLMALLIEEAHRQQSAMKPDSSHFAGPSMPFSPERDRRFPLWRLLPPPQRWRPLVSRLPTPLQQALALRLLAPAIASSQAMQTLQPIRGRRLGIRVDDLGLEWVFELHERGLQLSRAPAEATVSGSFTDLLRLASRLEDADTLFFQRKLTLTGDTELGLTLRNLLDRLPWESLPLGQRILLQRGARLACRARQAYRDAQGAA